MEEADMRKIAITMLVLLLAAGSIGAETLNKIGVTAGPSFGWGFSLSGEKLGSNSGSARLLVLVDAVTYFGDDGGFGLSIGIGTTMNLKQWGDYAEGMDILFSPDEFGAGLTFKAGLGYRYAFSSLIGLEIGAGILGTMTWIDSYWLGPAEISLTAFELDAYGDIGIDVMVARTFCIDVGVMLSGPVFANYNTQVSDHYYFYGESSGDNLDLGAFCITPYIGLSAVY